MRASFLSLALLSSASAFAATQYKKLSLSDVFFCEGATVADLNRDGHPDVVSGPYWYAGPDFSARHVIYKPVPLDPLKYSENFLAYNHDFNGDGWTDVLIIGFPGKETWWMENPGKALDTADTDGWKRHVAFPLVDNESPVFGDLLGNGKPVLVCSTGGKLGYASPDPREPTKEWTFHPISTPGPWQRFTHGIGYGDINGDGRADLLERDAWWEQPSSLDGDPVWKKHEFKFSSGRGGAQMLVTDVNGDRKADVVTSIDAHGYGLSWFEQTRGDDGTISFREHVILSAKADEKIGGLQFSQLHALALADIDGDRLPDIVTGKRWWAHGPTGDQDAGGPAVLYAFLLRRGKDGSVTFEPRQLDDASGVGTQVTIADLNHDSRPDIIVGNKKGTFVHLSQKSKKAP